MIQHPRLSLVYLGIRWDHSC